MLCLSLLECRIEGLVTEDDLRQLVSSLGVSAREPELEGWESVIAMGNDTVSYKAWCEKTKVVLTPFSLSHSSYSYLARVCLSQILTSIVGYLGSIWRSRPETR